MVQVGTILVMGGLHDQPRERPQHEHVLLPGQACARTTPKLGQLALKLRQPATASVVGGPQRGPLLPTLSNSLFLYREHLDIGRSLFSAWLGCLIGAIPGMARLDQVGVDGGAAYPQLFLDGFNAAHQIMALITKEMNQAVLMD